MSIQQRCAEFSGKNQSVRATAFSGRTRRSFILFEDWLEELENEAVSLIKRRGSTTPEDLSRELGLSESGAMFVITKLKRDGKI